MISKTQAVQTKKPEKRTIKKAAAYLFKVLQQPDLQHSVCRTAKKHMLFQKSIPPISEKYISYQRKRATPRLLA